MPYFVWNNHTLFYRQQGQGPLLLVLPGNTAASVFHQGELDYFSDRCSSNPCQVAALDFLGAGQSERIEVWPDNWWEQSAAQAAGLAAHLGYDEFTVMGTSGGAVVALLAAALFPGQLRAVIADSCSERFTPEMAQAMRQERGQRTPDQVRFWREAQGDDWEQVIEADTNMLLRLAERGGDWFSGRLGDRLAGIRCPVLLTASKQDVSIGDAAQQLARLSERIADCRAFLAPRGGHPLMWSSPQDFRLVSDAFLAIIKTEQSGIN